MIFRKQPNNSRNSDTPLERIISRVKSVPGLQLAVVDLLVEGDTLVVFCSESRMMKFIELVLAKHWPGDIETICAAEMMVGGNASRSDQAGFHETGASHSIH